MSSLISSKPLSPNNCASISFHSHLNPFPLLRLPLSRTSNTPSLPSIQCGLRQIRERIETVKSTQKVTEAMKLVAAAKVRRAQEAVINGRPFAESLVEMLYSINEQCQLDDVEVPLTAVRPVRSVALIVVTGERGLCGGFNNAILKKAELRMEELRNQGLDCTLISVGKKGNAYFRRRDDVKVDRFVEGQSFPTTKEAQVIADYIFSLFLCEEVDKVELLYTKFVSLIKSDPVVHTLLPLSAEGEVRDVNGRSIDVGDDEFFRLTTKGGKLAVKRDHVTVKKKKGMVPVYEFEQDPAQILDALMPLYLNSQILRALQESFASELASRMNAMSNATDNAVELKKSLSMALNRERQAKITGDLLEIIAGAEFLRDSD
ncbi:hypothetical protein SASPL_114235 [Salvia splendens]|uniref:F-ATPase gamma subunit n=1 Tax=Salvia splendens TaxID=180675 RepID=A0A8X8Y4B0_SALSN|nr:ATP synthase gamma chain 2, chloroplastic-like [Salvia splendens]KAG6423832.1 hypothetical protein SASPL_114235 [Salvia splendens]